MLQALIVADAYKRTSWTDWIGPLYKKVIIGGQFLYLGDFRTAFPMKANMFQELANKYVYMYVCTCMYVHTYLWDFIFIVYWPKRRACTYQYVCQYLKQYIQIVY